MKPINSSVVSSSYFSEACMNSIKKHECDIAGGYYTVKSLINDAVMLNLNDEDVRELRNLEKSGCSFVKFEN